jgi:antitoxin YefM
MLTENIIYSENKEITVTLLDEVCDRSEIVVIKRPNQKNVALISETELSSLLESIYILRSPENARRFFRALEWTEKEEGIPQTITELKQELGIES